MATFIVAFFIRTNISVAFFDMAFNIMALVASLLYIRLDLVSSSSSQRLLDTFLLHNSLHSLDSDSIYFSNIAAPRHAFIQLGFRLLSSSEWLGDRDEQSTAH